MASALAPPTEPPAGKRGHGPEDGAVLVVRLDHATNVVEDVEDAVGTDRDAHRVAVLAGRIPESAPRSHEVPMGVEFLDPSIPDIEDEERAVR